MKRARSRVLIVGQGIGGTSLAWTCIQKGLDFTIIDDGYKSSSSLAAAGLFNPLIVKRKKLTWRANEFCSKLEGFYRFIEVQLGIQIFHKHGIYRRIASVAELNDWYALQSDPRFEKFLGGIYSSDSSEGLDAPYGYQEVKEAGYVDVDLYLRKSREYFQSSGRLQEGVFDVKHLEEVQDRECDKCILALGVGSTEHNEHFQGLPFEPAKGHTIEIHCEGLGLKGPINGPCFIIPLGGDMYRVGSTYSWSNFNNETEEKEVEKLRTAFESICESPYTIEKEWAGVRPATKDRRPFIGTNDPAGDIYIFNGLGSRAILSTPTLALQLLDHITQGSPLWPEVEVGRFLA